MSTGTESTSSSTLADQVYDNTMAGPNVTKAGFGLHYAIAGISNLADELQGLEGAAAAMATDLGQTMMEYSDAENADTQEQTQILKDLPAPDDNSKDSTTINADRSKDINDQQALISSHQTIYGNEIQTVDAMSQQWQTTTSSIAQGIASLYNIIGEIIQVIGNLASRM